MLAVCLGAVPRAAVVTCLKVPISVPVGRPPPPAGAAAAAACLASVSDFSVTLLVPSSPAGSDMTTVRSCSPRSISGTVRRALTVASGAKPATATPLPQSQEFSDGSTDATAGHVHMAQARRQGPGYVRLLASMAEADLANAMHTRARSGGRGSVWLLRRWWFPLYFFVSHVSMSVQRRLYASQEIDLMSSQLRSLC